MTAGLKWPPEMWPDGRRHDRDREAVGERDTEDAARREHDRAHADEDQRECADQLRDAAAKGVVLHAARLGIGSDGTPGNTGVR